MLQRIMVRRVDGCTWTYLISTPRHHRHEAPLARRDLHAATEQRTLDVEDGVAAVGGVGEVHAAPRPEPLEMAIDLEIVSV